jgi:hypothetical protein
MRWMWLVLLILGFSARADAQPNAPTTVQLPTFGISINAHGVLRNATFAGAAPQLGRQRRAALAAAEAGDHFTASDCRKVSLGRLEKAILRQQDNGQTCDETMLHLAGLQRVEYVFIYPDLQDVVVAGPAGGWVRDPAGRVVDVDTGKPVILLEDLLVALRIFQAAAERPPGAAPWIGCSIDLTPEGIERFVAFRRTIPSQVNMAVRDAVATQIATGSVASLGKATVSIFGISGDTHMANVLVEADYRMKLIGLGLEPPPVRMATFINQMRRPPKQMQRWWFTPDVHRLVATPDDLAIQFVGAGVKLSTERFAVDGQGQIQRKATASSAAARRYAESFTKKYDEIAKASSIYWQLRNMVDLLVAAAWLNQVDAAQHLQGAPLSLIDDAIINIHVWPVPRQAECVSNAIWKGNVLLAPVGGGVSIHAADALYPANVRRDVKFEDVREASKPQDENWWWD